MENKELKEALEIIDLLIKALNSTPAYWGDAFGKKEFARIKDFLKRNGRGDWFDPD